VLRTEKRRCGGAGQLNSPGNGKLWEQMSGISSRTVRFGVFEVDLDRSELRKQELRVRLQEQPFQVLAALLSTPGEVVTREELIRRLWPDGTVVDFDRGLNAAVIACGRRRPTRRTIRGTSRRRRGAAIDS